MVIIVDCPIVLCAQKTEFREILKHKVQKVLNENKLRPFQKGTLQLVTKRQPHIVASGKDQIVIHLSCKGEKRYWNSNRTEVL